jgi:hypothetical protein
VYRVVLRSLSEVLAMRGLFPLRATQLTPDNEVRELQRGEQFEVLHQDRHAAFEFFRT